MIRFKHSGSFSNSERFLVRNKSKTFNQLLERCGRQGIRALVQATPVDSGITAESWNYEIKRSKGRYEITWTNSHVVDGVNIAVIIQYGHGTGSGGYVEGRDYINPAMKPIFDRIAEDLYTEVTKV